MTDHAHELRRHARKIAHPAGDVPAVMLAAADEIERLRTESAGLVDDMNLLRDNNTALRARVEAMEQQESVAEWVDGAFDQYPHLIWREPYKAIVGAKLYTKLYALPGAKGEEK